MHVNKQKLDLSNSEVQKEVKISNEEDVVLKDIFPDMDSVVDTFASIENLEANIEGNKVRLNGKVACEIIYISNEDKRVVHSTYYKSSFEDIIDLKEGCENLIVDNLELKSKLEYFSFKIINSRKFNIRYIVDAILNLENKVEVEVALDVKEDSKDLNSEDEFMKKLKCSKDDNVGEIKNLSEENLTNSCLYSRYKDINVYRKVKRITKKVVLRENYQISDSKPEVEEILKSRVKPMEIEIDKIDENFFVRGNITFDILYNSIDNELVHLNFAFPLKEELDDYELDKYKDMELDDKYINYNLKVLDKNIHIAENLDGESRVIEVEVNLEFDMSFYSEDSIRVLDDVHDIKHKLSIDNKYIEYQNLLCKNDNSYSIKQVLKLDVKDILQIVDVEANLENLVVDIKDGVAKVEGDIVGKVLCIVADDMKPLQSIDFKFEIAQNVETQGTNRFNNDYNCVINAIVENVSTNLLNPEELEMKFTLRMNLTVLSKKNDIVIGDVEVAGEIEDSNELGLVKIHVVQNDETVWDIIKKYNSRIDNIMIKDIDNLTLDTTVKKDTKVLIL